MGEAYQELEQKWAQFNDLDPAGMVACNSGTAALHLSLEAMQLPQGSQVIVPDFNMIAVPRAVTLAGLTPVFVDCDETLNMDPELLVVDVSAIMAVHIYGRQCNMEAIHKFNEIMNSRIIEDLAEAHGVKPHPLTNAACWSFYQNKIVSGAEGGAVWFRDTAHAVLARQLRSLGFTGAHDFNHIPRGHNYRMSNVHASLVLDSLRNYGHNLAGRREQEQLLDAACPHEWRMPPRQAPWVYDLRIKGMTSVQQDAIVRHLNEIGIAARHAFKPMCDQQEYKTCKMVAADNINGTKSRLASREVIYLPLTPGRPRIDMVVFEEIKRVLDRKV